MSALWLIGCGNMAGAMLRRWLETGLDPAEVTVIDPAPCRIAGVRWLNAPPIGEPAPTTLLLGVKPQLLKTVAPLVAPLLGQNTLLVSILAGVELDVLRGYFAGAGAIVRAMPNLPVEFGKGVVGLFTHDDVRARVDALMMALGQIEWLADEGQFHALTAVSGSGPAFVYRFLDALAAAGTGLGLPADQALRLAKAMVEGAAMQALRAPYDPATLAQMVASPGGTTAQGLAVLDHDDAMMRLIADTLGATARRSAEMADEAKR